MRHRLTMTLGAVLVLSSGLALTAAAPVSAAAAKADVALEAAVGSPARPAGDMKRDGFRHPYESLTFWGLKPGMTVVDLEPGGGYWTQIIAPYLAKAGGTYVGGGGERGRAGFETKFADKARYGTVKYAVFGKGSGPIAPAGTVDLIITARELHNWIPNGFLDEGMAKAFAALKPGGYLAVEDHRADPRAQLKDTSDGYVSTDYVVAAAKKAGFRLDAKSEVNANPKDTKDHPFGVWTLPPSRQSTPDGRSEDPAFQHAKYDAIGESDRMTLRFRKP